MPLRCRIRHCSIRRCSNTSLGYHEGRRGDRVEALVSWDDVKLLSVSVDRLTRWYRPGLLCIGDAAHALSPMGAVGINLAVQDAVAAAKILLPPLRLGSVAPHHLRAVEQRRAWPTRATQALQLLVQNRVIAPPSARRPAQGRRSWQRFSNGCRRCDASPAGSSALARGPSTSLPHFWRKRAPR
jgi:2-polyprenyl-6-methoxyphenol hydroxylase-like FAD-dependent oxidoreductase